MSSRDADPSLIRASADFSGWDPSSIFSDHAPVKARDSGGAYDFDIEDRRDIRKDSKSKTAQIRKLSKLLSNPNMSGISSDTAGLQHRSYDEVEQSRLSSEVEQRSLDDTNEENSYFNSRSENIPGESSEAAFTLGPPGNYIDQQRGEEKEELDDDADEIQQNKLLAIQQEEEEKEKEDKEKKEKEEIIKREIDEIKKKEEEMHRIMIAKQREEEQLRLEAEKQIKREREEEGWVAVKRER